MRTPGNIEPRRPVGATYAMASDAGQVRDQRPNLGAILGIAMHFTVDTYLSITGIILGLVALAMAVPPFIKCFLARPRSLFVLIIVNLSIPMANLCKSMLQTTLFL